MGQANSRPVVQIIRRLREYYSDDEVRAWLNAKHPQLNGRSAMDLIRANRTEEVVAVLDRLESSAYL